MTDQALDHPNVIIFPPILLLTTVIAGLLLDWLFPIEILETVPKVARLVVGAVMLCLGASMPIVARRAFKEAGTNIRPTKPTTAIIASGLYAHTRNPIYQGAAVALLGLALLLGSDWILLLMLTMLLVLHFGVILREERYLDRKFGEPYRSYKATVPRYGWKF
jgi:protein-S-isoprenylcysteine O-methyltransferase Ste14